MAERIESPFLPFSNSHFLIPISAGGTITVDVEFVTRDGKIGAVGEFLLVIAERAVPDGHDLFAFETNQMMAVQMAVEFEKRFGTANRQFGGQVLFAKGLQRPIDRGEIDRDLFGAHLRIHLLGGDRLVVLFEQFEDFPAVQGVFQASAPYQRRQVLVHSAHSFQAAFPVLGLINARSA